MIMNVIIYIQQAVYCKFNDMLSASFLYGYTLGGVTHTRTFEDSVYPHKHIGVFTKRREVATNYTRA